jgi:hypothetical protein
MLNPLRLEQALHLFSQHRLMKKDEIDGGFT